MPNPWTGLPPHNQTASEALHPSLTSCPNRLLDLARAAARHNIRARAWPAACRLRSGRSIPRVARIGHGPIRPDRTESATVLYLALRAAPLFHRLANTNPRHRHARSPIVLSLFGSRRSPLLPISAPDSTGGATTNSEQKTLGARSFAWLGLTFRQCGCFHDIRP